MTRLRDCSTMLALYAEVAVETAASSAASTLHALMEPWADQFIFNTFAGYAHVRMWLGLLAAVVGQHEQADRHLAFACQFHEANGVWVWAARGRLGWAEALAVRGERRSARASMPSARSRSRASMDTGYSSRARPSWPRLSQRPAPDAALGWSTAAPAFALCAVAVAKRRSVSAGRWFGGV